MKPTNSIVITILFFLTVAVSAAPPQPQAIPPPVGSQVSINSNIMFLFASGILLGAYFVIKRK